MSFLPKSSSYGASSDVHLSRFLLERLSRGPETTGPSPETTGTADCRTDSMGLNSFAEGRPVVLERVRRDQYGVWGRTRRPGSSHQND